MSFSLHWVVSCFGIDEACLFVCRIHDDGVWHDTFLGFQFLLFAVHLYHYLALHFHVTNSCNSHE